MDLRTIFDLDEQIERLEDRLEPLNLSEQREYQALKVAMQAAEIEYYTQNRKPSPYSMVTMIANKRRDDVPTPTYYPPIFPAS